MPKAMMNGVEVDLSVEEWVRAVYRAQQWTLAGVDLGAGDDTSQEVEITFGSDGKATVTKITQLYGRPGNIKFGDDRETIDLKKGKDGIWK